MVNTSNKVTYEVNLGMYKNIPENTYGILTTKGSWIVSSEYNGIIIEIL